MSNLDHWFRAEDALADVKTYYDRNGVRRIYYPTPTGVERASHFDRTRTSSTFIDNTTYRCSHPLSLQGPLEKGNIGANSARQSSVKQPNDSSIEYKAGNGDGE